MHFSGFAAQNRSGEMAILAHIFHFYTVNILKKYLTDLSETYRLHDMVIHLCILQISDLYIFFHGPDGVENNRTKY